MPTPTTARPPEPEPIEFTLRLPDKRLAEVLQVCADEDRRSRNTFIVLLLEQVMKDRGRWPPAS